MCMRKLHDSRSQRMQKKIGKLPPGQSNHDCTAIYLHDQLIHSAAPFQPTTVLYCAAESGSLYPARLSFGKMKSYTLMTCRCLNQDKTGYEISKT
jgi:hypothetical protein